MSEKALSVEQIEKIIIGCYDKQYDRDSEIEHEQAKAIHDVLPELVSVEELADILQKSQEGFHRQDAKQINNCSMHDMWKREKQFIAKAIQPYTSSAMPERVKELEADIEKFKANNRYQRGYHDGQIAEYSKSTETIRTLTAQLADAIDVIRQINYQAVNCMSINSLRKHIKGISRSVLEASHD